MSRRSKPLSRNRREFLRQCAAVGGSAAVIAAAGGSVAQSAGDEAAPTAAKEQPKGYRLTPHIQDYYEKASL